LKKDTLYILHVEDNDINRSLFQSAINRYGDQHVVHSVVNAHEALQHLSVITYDIIFIDLHLRGSDAPIEPIFTKWLNSSQSGESVIRYCFDKGIEKTSKVIVCTASNLQADDLVSKYGFSLLKLVKPFRTERLIKIINDSLAS